MNRSEVFNVVKTFVINGSHFGPKKTILASNAPLLIPVTTSKSGRFPVAVHPATTPAANALYCPPPDNANTFNGR